MKWSAYLLRPMTGQVGRKLSLVHEGDWDILLNDIEEAEVTVKKSELKKVDSSWWEPWRGGIVLTVSSAFLGEQPFIAGPIVAPPDETFENAKFKMSGVRAFFTKRVVANDDYVPGQERQLASSVLRYTGLSLGTIAYEIVQRSISKTAGYLPIKHGSPYESGSGLNERTYEGFNLANNNTDKRLSELSDVINGPDIMFRPRWGEEDRSTIVWDLVHGTAAQPAIEQKWTMTLDTTATRTPVNDVTVKSNAEHMANRAYWTGAGEGAGTAIAIAQDVRAFRANDPLLEIVGSDNDSENTGLIREKAQAAISIGQKALIQVTLVVDGDNRMSLLGRWKVGDSANVKLSGWLTIPDGMYSMRIISAKGSIGSQYATLEFQEDVL